MTARIAATVVDGELKLDEPFIAAAHTSDRHHRTGFRPGPTPSSLGTFPTTGPRTSVTSRWARLGSRGFI